MIGDEYDKFMRELRQAGVAKPAAEGLANRIFPLSPNGTRFKLEVADDGTVTATAI